MNTIYLDCNALPRQLWLWVHRKSVCESFEGHCVSPSRSMDRSIQLLNVSKHKLTNSLQLNFDYVHLC